MLIIMMSNPIPGQCPLDLVLDWSKYTAIIITLALSIISLWLWVNKFIALIKKEKYY